MGSTPTGSNRVTDDEIDDLIEQWHAGEFPSRPLEEVIQSRTGWTKVQYGRWLMRGTPWLISGDWTPSS